MMSALRAPFDFARFTRAKIVRAFGERRFGVEFQRPFRPHEFSWNIRLWRVARIIRLLDRRFRKSADAVSTEVFGPVQRHVG